MEQESLKFKKVDKGTVLLRQGEYCKNGFRVVSGCLKSYVIDKSGKEHILQFAPENWLISDLKSVIDKVPSAIFIEAVENSEVQLLPIGELDSMALMPTQALLEHNKTLVRNVIASNQRIKLLLCSTAEERYVDFMETYPSLLQRLPLKLIASYLGMTPEYLSEIRRKIAQKQPK